MAAQYLHFAEQSNLVPRNHRNVLDIWIISKWGQIMLFVYNDFSPTLLLYSYLQALWGVDLDPPSLVSRETLIHLRTGLIPESALLHIKRSVLY